MLFLQGADNWRIYERQFDPKHSRVEALYQAWLGGLDRPYTRPRFCCFQPIWLEKKRQQLRPPDLQGPQTPMERYVLEWYQKFFSFRGTLRPTVEDLHTAFFLVDEPLDLSYALTILGYCHNKNGVRYVEDTFTIFLEACLRVDRKDVALQALEAPEKYGFWHVDADVRKFLQGEQTWYRRDKDGKYLPLAENMQLNGEASASDDDEEAKLQAELKALEEEERLLSGK